MGGVCLNEGCIPTKALLYSAKVLDGIKSAPKYGVSVEGAPAFDMEKIIGRKNKTVQKLTGGVRMTVNSYGVTIVDKEAVKKDSISAVMERYTRQPICWFVPDRIP